MVSLETLSAIRE